jgi:adenosylhomocysteine nucleosidase
MAGNGANAEAQTTADDRMDTIGAVVLVSAESEWRVVRTRFGAWATQTSPAGEWFATALEVDGRLLPVVFLHGGWGKIAAAASTQYAVDRWRPPLLVNLGTCGGFAGLVEKGTVVLAERTVVYDIVERMGDPEAAIQWFATDLDLAWLGGPDPHPVRRGLLLSGDADLDPAAVAGLHARYGAVAGDWESGAIAYVAARNGVRCLILRGVSDLVGGDGGEAYGDNHQVFVEGATAVMGRLLDVLPAWLARPGR